jgi:hypothetical protein
MLRPTSSIRCHCSWDGIFISIRLEAATKPTAFSDWAMAASTARRPSSSSEISSWRYKRIRWFNVSNVR